MKKQKIYQDRSASALEKKAKKLQGATYSPADIDVTILNTIPYQYPHRKIAVEMACEEFSSICPFSGLPDFARVTITYIPRRKLIELKSLKYYLYAWRNVKVYNEHVINQILEDLQQTLQPWSITVIGEFTSRGGITNKIVASYPAQKKPYT